MNEYEIEVLYQLVMEIGIDEVCLKMVQIYDFEKDGYFIFDFEYYFCYVKCFDGSYWFKLKGGNFCWRMWSLVVIIWDGRMVLCCFDKDVYYCMGDLVNQSFEDIWGFVEYQFFCCQILEDCSVIDICINCLEGVKVWVE